MYTSCVYHAKISKVQKLDDDTIPPYLSMKVYDLRNMITMEPVISVPVQTDAGLLNIGFYQAFDAEHGVLRWTHETSPRQVLGDDRACIRVATLLGGTQSQVISFNPDIVYSSRFYEEASDINRIISPAEYTDLHYLATLCSRNKLVVAPPNKLASVTAPALTLDRDGVLAVYVGRAACGVDTSRDILMFRPTSTREEEDVDVPIITQLLEPILAARKADGTIIFEAYGQTHRKLSHPDEVLMLCIDLSSSMLGRCGFPDIRRNEDADASVQRTNQAMAENAQFHLPEPDDLKGLPLLRLLKVDTI